MTASNAETRRPGEATRFQNQPAEMESDATNDTTRGIHGARHDALVTSPIPAEIAVSDIPATNRGRVVGRVTDWPQLVAETLAAPPVFKCDMADKAARDRAKAKAGSWIHGRFADGKRNLASFLDRQTIALDIEQKHDDKTGQWVGEPVVIDAVVDALDSLDLLEGVAWVAHETFNSTPERPRLRAFLPLSRPVTLTEYGRLTLAVMEAMPGISFDQCSTQGERVMYKPARPTADRAWWAEAREGGAIDVDAALAWAPAYTRDTVVVANDESAGQSLLDLIDERADEEPCEKVRRIVDDFVTGLDDPEAFFEARGKKAEPYRHGVLLYALNALLGSVASGHRGGRWALDRVDEAFRAATGRDANDGAHAVLDAASRQAALREKEGFSEPHEAGLCTRFEAFDPSDFDDGYVDEDDLWSQTPVLEKIAQGARARIMSREAALAMVLGRVLADVPPNVVLPAVVGARASLNLAVALVGQSGAGKSSGFQFSAELLGLDQSDIERGIGSGEGLVNSFLGDPEKDPVTGKKEKRLVDDPRRIFVCDEVDQLAAIKGRNGATLGPVVRSATTGGLLGQENASEDRRRLVKANTYRAVLFLGVQPTRSGALLGEEDAGTPQRFLWANTEDAGLTEDFPDWPGELGYRSRWPHLMPADFDEEMEPVPVPWIEVDYPEHVKDEVRLNALRQRQGKVSPEKGHLMLTRLKVAAALAFLHNADEITDQWWTISGQVIERSQVTMRRCKAILGVEAEKRAVVEGRMIAVREAATAEVRGEAAEAEETAIAAAMWRIVDRHRVEVNSNTRHAAGEPCTARCLNNAAKRVEQQRRASVKEAALDLAEDRGWLRIEDGKITPGSSRPAD